MEEVNSTISQNEDIKHLLTYENLTGTDLKRHLILTFGSFREAARTASISESRLHQLFMGYKIPKHPEILKRIAAAWNLNLVVFLKVLEQIKKEEETK